MFGGDTRPVRSRQAVTDTILPGQSIRVVQTITSKGSTFELGFFTPNDSGKYYVGIWYKNLQNRTEVWVANRDKPIIPARYGASIIDDANLTFTEEGDLQLRVYSRIIWSTNTATTDRNTAKVVLHDSGNLIVGSDSSPNMWESFNYPTHTWLPGAKIGLDTTTNEAKPIILTSWRNLDDPGSGNYTFGMDENGLGDFLVRRIGASNCSKINLESILNLHYSVSRTNMVNYATYNSTSKNNIPVRLMLNYDGQLNLLMWVERKTKWLVYWSQPRNVCESDGFCGKYGICSINQIPPCNCPPDFGPAYLSNWELSDYFEGCVRNNLECHKDKDSFITLDNINFETNTYVYTPPIKLYFGLKALKKQKNIAYYVSF